MDEPYEEEGVDLIWEESVTCGRHAPIHGWDCKLYEQHEFMPKLEKEAKSDVKRTFHADDVE